MCDRERERERERETLKDGERAGISNLAKQGEGKSAGSALAAVAMAY